jgi:5-methylcytosine-specific restriction endonuclease McrA
MAVVDSTSYANLVLLQRTYAQQENRCWMRARKKFLIEELKKNGSLRCHYCGRNDLKITSKKRGEVATVDHFIAKSNGGDPYSHENFRVCCSSCNKKKASHDPLDFICSKYLRNKIQSLPKK